MNDLNTALETQRELTSACQQYREDPVPLSRGGNEYFSFFLYYHFEEGWGQRVVTRRASFRTLEAWVFPKEPIEQAFRNHFSTLQQASLDYLETSLESQ